MVKGTKKKPDRRKAVRRLANIPVMVDHRVHQRRKHSPMSQARYCVKCGTQLDPPGSTCPAC